MFMTLPRGYTPPKKLIHDANNIASNIESKKTNNDGNDLTGSAQNTITDESLKIKRDKKIDPKESVATMDDISNHKDFTNEHEIAKEIKQGNNNEKVSSNDVLDQGIEHEENIFSPSTYVSNNGNKTNNNNYPKSTKKELIIKAKDNVDEYQTQEIINKFQSISSAYNDLQKNIVNISYSVFSEFFDIYNESFWNKKPIFERYADVYNKTHQNMTNSSINNTRRINEFVLSSTESFNKSLEIVQEYYKDSLQLYFNFINKIEKSYN